MASYGSLADPDEIVTEPSTFTLIYDKVSTNIMTISNNTTVIDKNRSQIGGKNDSQALRSRIHKTIASTNNLVGETARGLKQLNQAASSRQQKLMVDRLKTDFEESGKRYNSVQRSVAQSLKTTLLIAAKHQGATSSLATELDENESRALLREQQDREKALESVQQQEMVLELDQAILEERETRLRELESNILDINAIMRDLGTMVHEQGEVIDTIEANVEKTNVRVTQGNEQLVKARSYQKGYRKKVCILIVILLIVGGIIAIIIATQLKK